MADNLVQLQTWLAAAQAAYHNLMIGKAAVKVAVDGATFVTEFKAADADKLEAYIARLDARIGRLTSGSHRGGAIGVIF